MNGQDPVQNFGNLKVHPVGALGFHHDLINNGFSDDNQGTVGFFSSNSIEISGAFTPVFRDVEIMVAQNLNLETAIGVTNNSNYIIGDIITPRNSSDVNIEYLNNAFYNGEDNLRKVNGYAAFTDKKDFIFPIGDVNNLRPLEVIGNTIIANAKSAYFFEDPNNTSTFPTSFDTTIHSDLLTRISTKEFWDLDAPVSSEVRLSWNSNSEINLLVNSLRELRVVGWHTENEMWEDLGVTAYNGSLDNGFITSDSFIPDDYSILTLGGAFDKSTVNLTNYYLSPNGNGINDFLVIEEVSLSPNNNLKIYNRWGRLVYSAVDYTNDFNGIANAKLVLNKGKILPSGVYFYIIDLEDIDVIHQGYLYINE